MEAASYTAGLQPPQVAPTPVSTQVPTPVPTQVPTLVPTQVSTPAPVDYSGGVIEAGLFSFYDPLIGASKPEIAFLNCERWNIDTQNCDSVMASGDDFREYYFKAAACRPDLFAARAKFKVLSPSWLKQLVPEFECLDTGYLVTGYYFDFLIPWQEIGFEYANVPWRQPISLLRIK